MSAFDQFDLESHPKIELHVHLEGSVAADTAAELARRHGRDPAEVLPLVDGRYPKRFTDFQEFVDLYVAVSAQIQEPDDLRVIAEAFAQAQAKQNIIYTETTFTAVTHVRHGMEPSEMWGALREGLEAGGGNVSLIVDTPRDNGVEAAHRTVEKMEEADAPIVGLGLTGIEGSAREGDFRVLREAADALTLGLAVHAGETGGPERVWAALDDLGADRIGHGVASARDATLVKRLAQDGIPVEACPSSNVSLGIFESLDEHPFPQLWRAGVNVTVNSDHPPFFSTTLAHELAHAARLAELTRDDVLELQRRATYAAFAAPDERFRLEERVSP
ncbi:adenosine deaminase [soil metagenome]